MTSYSDFHLPSKVPCKLISTWFPKGFTPRRTAAQSSALGQAARTLGGLAALMLTLPAFAGSFQGIGDLPGGSFESRAYGVSADGKVVVGAGTSSEGTEAFRWNPDQEMVGLGDLPGGDFSSRANGVSANGAVIVGTSTSSQGTEAFRWTPENGMVGLGDLPGGPFYSEGNGVSANGKVVVGTSVNAVEHGVPGRAPFRWTESDGMVGLAPADFYGYTSGNGVSADGTVVVGTYADGAFQWTAAKGITILPVPLGTVFDDRAYGVSPDGTVVVGSARTTNTAHTRTGWEAIRWTEDQGAVDLGTLPGGGNSFFPGDTAAYAASANGAVIVGTSGSAEGQQAFIWDDKNGMRSLLDVLVASGLDLTGWWLTEATALSADGLTIVGYGRNPAGLTEGWIATLEPVPVPEIQATMAPTSLALLAGGLLLLREGVRKRRSPAASMGAD